MPADVPLVAVEPEELGAAPEPVEAGVATGWVVVEVLCDPPAVVPGVSPVAEPDGVGVLVVEVEAPAELVVPLPVVDDVVPGAPVSPVEEPGEPAVEAPVPVPLAGVAVEEGVVTTP